MRFAGASLVVTLFVESALAASGSGGLAGPAFLDVTWEWGLYAQHQQRRESLTSLSETLGAGACVLDVDNDGWMDLLLVGGNGQRREYGAAAWWQAPQSHRLYRNDSGTRFIDITADSGFLPSWGMGCAVADWDADGDEDVLITGYDSTRLYSNQGLGHFAAVDDSGIADQGWATSASVADFDGDGLEDIYIAHFLNYQRGQHALEAASGFSAGADAEFDPTLHEAQANKLYRNLGGNRFRDVTAAAGVANMAGRSLQGLWVQLDDDDAVDLVVTNAQGSPPVFYLNALQDGFSKAHNQWQFSASEGVHGSAVMPQAPASPARLIAGTGAGQPLSLANITGQAAANPWDLGLARDADLSFMGWGIAVADLDNNGAVDVVVAHGSTLPDPDAPELPLGQPNALYWGNRNGTFTPSSAGPVLESSRGVVTLDANNDGALDIVFTNNNDAPQLLLNNTSAQGHWLGLVFLDTSGRRLTHGVTVRYKDNTGQVYSPLPGSQGFLSRSDPRLHIGLGEVASVDSLWVHWPDGSQSHYSGLLMNSYQILQQGQSLPVAIKRDKPVQSLQHLQHRRFYRRFGALYVHLLVHAGNDANQRDFVRAVTGDSGEASIDALLAAIQALPARAHADWLFLLARGLQSGRTDIQLSTLEVLERWELEASMRYLLPVLTHHNSAIVCRAARVLQHFYQEEEAVIQHKYLAVPALVKLLDRAGASVQICAMRALAEAERVRGLSRLLELARNADPAVAAQALETVGRLRQREAVPQLHKIATELPAVSALQPFLAQGLRLLSAEEQRPGNHPLAAQSRANASTSHTAVLTQEQRAILAELERLFFSKASHSEHALLSLLASTGDESVWLQFLNTVTQFDSARGRRLLFKNLQHREDAIVEMILAKSDQLYQDPLYARQLWRQLAATESRPALRRALLLELGKRDAPAVIAQLPSLENLL